jgi:hypothetical protein
VPHRPTDFSEHVGILHIGWPEELSRSKEAKPKADRQRNGDGQGT